MVAGQPAEPGHDRELPAAAGPGSTRSAGATGTDRDPIRRRPEDNGSGLPGRPTMARGHVSAPG
ncbi:hypothetical protein [Frankia sp. Cas4]|uniref:hypothetical protein n=1 Tax=Frankia sp. Cas4 TaxID=3073927 RepID=UPI002AD5349C|nr:hypothetical protein [Frankia sp. Cas4]